ncbi:actin family protein [Niveomyces insectorum RCEF 264]|uniref:Actin family protein n=1 Tax=Niveomyces insectorum RCEF 264 TaxID=1081102 RepID=A0A167XZU8_9HYPO|nr:actin family protein [Niveomyces insectorum RCEF 264]
MAGGRTTKGRTVPAPATPAPAPPPARTLVLDNGAYTLKAGFADRDGGSSGIPGPVVIPNCLVRDRQRRTYIGAEVTERCRDFGEATFRRPVEKGYIVNWEAQRAIWAHTFLGDGDGDAGDDGGNGGGISGLRCDPADTRLVLTEQPNALPALQANCDQMVFEEFQFASYYRGTAAQFNAYLDVDNTTPTEPAASALSPTVPAEIRLVVDSGYSCTTVTPVLHGRPVHRAVRRLEVGGKLLTNYLTKLLSVRHYDMRHDTYIVNEIKEQACYVALDFAGDLDKTWKGPRATAAAVLNDANGADDAGPYRRRRALFRAGSAGIAKEYVLPDYHTRMRGIVREYDPTRRAATNRLSAAGGHNDSDDDLPLEEDVLVLRNERFAVPELLFHPGDVGLRQQPGLPDVVAQSVAALPVGLWPALLANIVVVGGNAELPGFVQRLQQEVQALLPDDLVVRVTRPADPITCTWRGAARFAAGADATEGGGPAAVERLAVTKQEYDEHGAGWVARKFAAGLAAVD